MVFTSCGFLDPPDCKISNISWCRKWWLTNDHRSKEKILIFYSFSFFLLLLFLSSKALKCCHSDLYSVISSPAFFFSLLPVLHSHFHCFIRAVLYLISLEKPMLGAINYCRASKTDHRQCWIAAVIIIFSVDGDEGWRTAGRNRPSLSHPACLTTLEVVWECVHTCALSDWISKTCSIRKTTFIIDVFASPSHSTECYFPLEVKPLFSNSAQVLLGGPSDHWLVQDLKNYVGLTESSLFLKMRKHPSLDHIPLNWTNWRFHTSYIELQMLSGVLRLWIESFVVGCNDKLISIPTISQLHLSEASC